MNKELTYHEMQIIGKAKQIINWQFEAETYASIIDFLDRAQHFVQTVELSESEASRMELIKNALSVYKPVFVEVQNYWFQVHSVHEQDRVVLLRRPSGDNSLPIENRVFIWEIKNVAIGQ